jgi:Periplasmic sensor domain
MLKFGDYSISRKLTRMNMFVSGAALLLACAAFVAYDVVAFRQDIARNLSIEAQIAGSNSVSALLFNDPREAEKTLSALRAAPNIVSAHIYTLEGQPRIGAIAAAKLRRCLRFPRVKPRPTGSRMGRSCLSARLSFRENQPESSTFNVISKT